MNNKIHYIYLTIIIFIIGFCISSSLKLEHSLGHINKLEQQIAKQQDSINQLKTALSNVNDDENSFIINIDYNTLLKLMADKQTFPLVISQATCSNCLKYKPTLNKVLNDYSLIAYEINLLSLGPEEYNNIASMFSVKGTPTTIFIIDGEEKSVSDRIVGNLPEEKVIEKFQNSNLIH